MRNKKGFIFALIPFIILFALLAVIFIFGYLFINKALASVKELGLAKYFLYGTIVLLVLVFREPIIMALKGIFRRVGLG